MSFLVLKAYLKLIHFWTPLRVMTRLARFLVTIRLDRRRPWKGELGIDLPLAPVYGLR